MPEYINKQELLEKAKEHQNNPFGISVLIAEIENAKGVDIVFCKECKHWVNEHGGFCSASYGLSEINNENQDFCSYGERREI